MAKRTKTQFTPIQNLDEFNTRLGQVAEIKRELVGIEHMMNESIDQAKSESDQAAAPLKAKLAEHEAALCAYAEYNKQTLFQERRSIELLFGAFGFRKSSQIKPARGNKVQDILNKLNEYGFIDAIRKGKDSLNKDVLGTWTDAKLQNVGAIREEKDTFWYEIKEEEIEEVS